MTLAALAPDWLFLLFGLAFLYAAAIDIHQRRIPNAAPIALALGGLVAAALAGPEASLWQNGLLFVAILVVGTFSFGRGWLGGGDVKLLAAASLWFGLADGARMIVATVLIGGVLTLLMLMGRIAFRGKDREKARLIPYGVAIALGAVGTGLWLRG
ncbi:A24 family peptidase [Sphingomicrobium astaxanthinifaciens]|uniref:A24 family peptidase n=1 Tax=Sphingomicrobium astaxanthinifaciens TaxID=1227949 RepID=UPI001FCA8D5E|nr:prepilin peptidase [Sphingomicrobium astaxanthinifaciens]MCJ7421292.1 prepilin peptidase [Sphingomicrobium astaxanthinifaciens]